MASRFKQKLPQNLYDVMNNKYYRGQYEEFVKQFKLVKEKDTNHIFWRCVFPVKLQNKPNLDIIQNNHQEFIDNGTISGIKVLDFDYSIQPSDYTVEYKLNLKSFIKDTINADPVALSFKPTRRKIVLEFSSPNIAKPFHMGHLRSTIIGNCLSNIKSKLQNDVVKLNYLGDWGTQLGLVQVGVKLLNFSDEDLKKDPITKLFKAYVKGNREAEMSMGIYESAKKIFCDLENEEEEAIKNWVKFKNWTLEELTKTYDRLGVTFDEYHWESDYKRKKADKILQILEGKGILATDDKGRKVVKLAEGETPLIKSDDTTLYLLRDLMALAHRSEKYNFDEMYYVVENGQNVHFHSLIQLNKELGLSKGNIEHVKFGRIQGMSTRKGRVTFLTDVLQEARERVCEAQIKSKNTRVSVDDTETQDILGVSAVVINDLKQRRKKDYEFSWDKVVQIRGDTGIFLQYCYCRLNSLEENCGLKPATECDPEALMDPASIDLIFEMAKFEETLLKADASLEPCILVSYLFKLVKSCNVAIKHLNVKNSGDHVGSQRLLMFIKCRTILEQGLKLLGVRTVKQM